MPAPSDPLSDLLRRSDPGAGAPPHAAAAFAAAVHARIQSADTTAPLRRSALARQLFPLAAALAVVASLAAGGSLAYAGAQRDRVEAKADAFARSIDPWLMHADRAPAHVHP
jgi:hypothetical protein